MKDDNEFELAVTFEKKFEMYNPDYAVGIDFNTDCYAVVVVDKTRRLLTTISFPTSSSALWNITPTRGSTAGSEDRR